MVRNILKNYKGFSNIDTNEQLRECLVKADALTHVALNSNLTEHPQSILHSYLWLLSDLINQAQKLNDRCS